MVRLANPESNARIDNPGASSGTHVFHRARSFLGHIFGWFLVLPLTSKFVRAAGKLRSTEEAVDFLTSFRFLGLSMAPWQDRLELTWLLKILEELKAGVIMEIGTAKGGTLFLFTRASEDDALIISLDLPGGLFGGGYPAWMSYLFRSFGRDHQTIHLVRGDSHSLDAVNEVRGALKGRKIDFLFIDGDHTYEGVKRDFETYSPFVRKGGIVAFHDICASGEGVGVQRFWEEIRQIYQTKVFVNEHSVEKFGIGVLSL